MPFLAKALPAQLFYLGMILGFMGSPGPLHAAHLPDEPWRLVRSRLGIEEYRHPTSGLRVLLREEHSAPVVTLMTVYGVGSRDESKGTRGFAHLLEHMMFRDSAAYRRPSGNSVPEMMNRIGAIFNGRTGHDATDFYAVIPRGGVETVLGIEADRMKNLTLGQEDLDLEKSVVGSEFDRLENSPLTSLEFALWGKTFGDHPYGRPVIGTRSDLKKATPQALREFYARFYRPDNCRLVITGDFRTGELLAKIDRYFGRIGALSQDPSPKRPGNAAVKRRFRRVTLHRADQMESLALAQPIPAFNSKDIPALEVLAQILGGGKTSRIYKGLVDRGLVNEAGTEMFKDHDAGLLITRAFFAPGTRHQEIEKRIFEIYRRLRIAGVSDRELVGAKAALGRRYNFQWDGTFALADALSEAVAAGDWTSFVDGPEKIKHVTVGDIHRVARKYLTKGNTTAARLVSKKRSARAKPREGAPPLPEAPKEKDFPKKTPVPAKAKQLGPEDSDGIFSGSKFSARVKTSRVGSIQAVTLGMGTPGIVSVAGSLDRAGLGYSPGKAIPVLVTLMLEEGTLKRGKLEIAEKLEEMGGEIRFQTGLERVGFQVRVLASDLEAAMGILAEELRMPAFDPREFEKKKAAARAALLKAASSPPEQCRAALSRAVYDSGHPAFQPKFERQMQELDRLSVRDLSEFHANHYGPHGMILVAAGDVTHEKFSALVKKFFGDWRKHKISKLKVSRVSMPMSGSMKHIQLPDKPQMTLALGHGIPFNMRDKRFYALYLANRILGGGMSGRFASRLRENLGLTYHIFSDLEDFGRDLEGSWHIEMILGAAHADQALAEIHTEIAGFLKEGAAPGELQDAKNGVLGSYQVKLDNTSGAAAALLRGLEWGFGPGFLEEFPLKISALKVEDVHEEARNFFHPNRLAAVLCGSFPEEPAGKEEG